MYYAVLLSLALWWLGSNVPECATGCVTWSICWTHDSDCILWLMWWLPVHPGVRVWPVTFSFHLSHLCVLESMLSWVFLTGTHQMSKSFFHQEITVLNRHENGNQAEMFKPKQAVAWGSAVWSHPQNGLCRVTAVRGEEQGLLSRWDQQGRHL